MIVKETQPYETRKANISNVMIREGNTEEESVWHSIHKKLLNRRNCDVRSEENLLSMLSFACNLSY